MSGKGKEYWSKVYDTCHTPGSHVAAVERCLKRYGYLCFSGTTYGKQVNNYFYMDSLSTFYNKCNSLDEVINKLKTAINNGPIYENGDLHQILKIMGKKSQNDESYYLSQFTIIKKPSIIDSFFSFFSKKNPEMQPILPEKNGSHRFKSQAH